MITCEYFVVERSVAGAAVAVVKAVARIKRYAAQAEAVEAVKSYNGGKVFKVITHIVPIQNGV